MIKTVQEMSATYGASKLLIIVLLLQGAHACMHDSLVQLPHLLSLFKLAPILALAFLLLWMKRLPYWLTLLDVVGA